MRFNHMELTFPVGSLTKDFREEIDAFYGSIFGWSALDTEVVGQNCHLLIPDPDQFHSVGREQQADVVTWLRSPRSASGHPRRG